MLQKFLLKKILKKWQFGDYEVIFWDGERLKIGNGSKFSIHFKRPLKYSKDLALSIAEGYMDGDIVDGEEVGSWRLTGNTLETVYEGEQTDAHVLELTETTFRYEIVNEYGSYTTKGIMTFKRK